MYLKYDYCPGFDSANHYSTIVIKKNEVQKPTQPPASKPTPPPPCQPTQPPASNPTQPPPSQPTQPPASNPTPPPPTQPHEQLQEESSENEEPVNIEHIQNQIDDLQKKQKKNPHKKRKRNRINMWHFEDVQINIVDELPWEIDGVQNIQENKYNGFLVG